MKAIVAVDNNWCIGQDEKLLFHIKEDLRRFRELTSNNVVIMGRKTFMSLPIKPLPHRVNVVLTTQTSFTYPNVITLHNISDICLFNPDKTFIIGGESIYRQCLPLCEEVYVTKILMNGQGNKYFPNIDNEYWNKAMIACNETEGMKYQFWLYKRL